MTINQSSSTATVTTDPISLLPASSVPVVDSQTEFQQSNVCSSSDSEPSPTSDSYTVPGSTMKETHIFTPSKPNAGENLSPSPLVPVPVTAAAVSTTSRSDIPSSESEQFSTDIIVIKENVVKKEYRDVEYEPNKMTASCDDFSEFQFVQPSVVIPNNFVIEPNSNVSNSNIPPMLTNYSADKNGLDALKTQINYSNHFDNSLKSAPPIDHSQSSIADTYSNHISNDNSLNNGNRSEFEFYSISEHFPSKNNAMVSNDTKTHAHAKNSMEIFSLSSIDQMHSVSASPLHATKVPPVRNSEMTTNHSSTVYPPQQNKTKIISTNSNTFFGSSNILQPQPVGTQAPNYQPFATMANNNALSIQWPEPGINSDQLEQLERRFSTNSTDTKVEQIEQKINDTATAADDEWSDFVSVVQPQTPITNILNKNLMKQQNHDEDDWSEFVSSTPSTMQSMHPQNSMPLNSNSNYDSVFKSWNVPFQSGPSQSSNYIIPPSNPLRQTECDATHNASHAYQSAHQSIAPSIISLPDLGFVAPKSLVNMPKRSIAKK